MFPWIPLHNPAFRKKRARNERQWWLMMTSLFPRHCGHWALAQCLAGIWLDPRHPNLLGKRYPNESLVFSSKRLFLLTSNFSLIWMRQIRIRTQPSLSSSTLSRTIWRQGTALLSLVSCFLRFFLLLSLFFPNSLFFSSLLLATLRMWIRYGTSSRPCVATTLLLPPISNAIAFRRLLTARGRATKTAER